MWLQSLDNEMWLYVTRVDSTMLCAHSRLWAPGCVCKLHNDIDVLWNLSHLYHVGLPASWKHVVTQISLFEMCSACVSHFPSTFQLEPCIEKPYAIIFATSPGAHRACIFFSNLWAPIGYTTMWSIRKRNWWKTVGLWRKTANVFGCCRSILESLSTRCQIQTERSPAWVEHKSLTGSGGIWEAFSGTGPLLLEAITSPSGSNQPSGHIGTGMNRCGRQQVTSCENSITQSQHNLFEYQRELLLNRCSCSCHRSMLHEAERHLHSSCVRTRNVCEIDDVLLHPSCVHNHLTDCSCSANLAALVMCACFFQCVLLLSELHCTRNVCNYVVLHTLLM